jgi:hypothetical protein
MKTLVTLERLASAAEQLLRETKNLRRDIHNLNNRIVAFEGTNDLSSEHETTGTDSKRTWTAVEALNAINEARRTLHNCEFELNAIRSRADSIESDAISREEMKPWIKR